MLAALMPAAGRAQDVAEAARREKARKAAKGERQSHVYTNEDLQKAEIVSREESAAVEERKKNSDGATVGAAGTPTLTTRQQSIATGTLTAIAVQPTILIVP